MPEATSHTPETFEQAAAALRSASAAGQRLRIVGGATKTRWGRPPAPLHGELHTSALNQIVAHNAGDMTATLEAGVPVAVAQESCAAAGQMLSLDPPLGAGATIGGVVATGDSGPLAHRYGGPRDLVVGATVALADGTIAKSGGTVIKNVAGYDIAKLMAGAFGTLGLILSVNVRVPPRRQLPARAAGGTTDARGLRRPGRALAIAPAELEALDVSWRDGRGVLLARVAGPSSEARARRLVQARTGGGRD